MDDELVDSTVSIIGIKGKDRGTKENTRRIEEVTGWTIPLESYKVDRDVWITVDVGSDRAGSCGKIV